MKKLHYDLAITGAGILGAMAAYHASQKGLRVLLLEAGSKPNHATVRNFGSIVASGQSKGTWRELGLQSASLYRQLKQEYKLPIRETGTYYIAQDKNEAQLLEEMAELDKQQGFHSALCSLTALHQVQPEIISNGICQALAYPDEMSIDSPEFMKLFLAILSGQPLLDLHYQARVTAVTGNFGAFEIKLDDDTVCCARQVLFCSGHSQAPITQSFFADEPMQLCKLQMMMTKPFARGRVRGNVFSGSSIRRYKAFTHCPSYPLLRQTERQRRLEAAGIHLMFKQAASGEIILGDSHQYFPLSVNHSPDYYIDCEINQLLFEEAEKLLAITSKSIKRQWLGWYLQHEKDVLYKSLAQGLHMVTGIGGKGMTVGPALMAKAIDSICKDGWLGSFE